MSRFIETIRYSGGKFHNLDRHIERIYRSLNGRPRWDITDMISEATPPGDFAAGSLEEDSAHHHIYKVRIVYDENLASVTTELYTIRPIRSLKIVSDNSIVYDHKYENREDLQALFAQRSECDDVLIVKNGVITDTSYCNIIFRKGDQWVTPSSYLLNGTMRQYLLATTQITEQRITPFDMPQFTHFKVINAMLRDEAMESEVSNIR